VTTKLAFVFGTWFGSGYAPIAPGTVASATALAVAYGCRHWLGWGPVEFTIMAALIFLPGVWCASVVERSIGREDPGIVVIDEIAGQWITLAGMTAFNWKSWLAAFLLFRLFDILKPPPIRKLERLHGGLGIMADDILAGVYGALVLYFAGRWNIY
jgi:phosphatidylglycerophosphatase A